RCRKMRFQPSSRRSDPTIIRWKTAQNQCAKSVSSRAAIRSIMLSAIGIGSRQACLIARSIVLDEEKAAVVEAIVRLCWVVGEVLAAANKAQCLLNRGIRVISAGSSKCLERKHRSR